MIESKQVLEWMAQGEARGEERGEARGRSAGEARGEANSLVRVLEKRFLSLPTELVKAIQAADDLALIRSWFDTAFQTASLEAFRQQTGL